MKNGLKDNIIDKNVKNTQMGGLVLNKGAYTIIVLCVLL